MNSDLYSAYISLLLSYDNVKYHESTPIQVIIKFECCTFLLFSSGKCRFMGNADINTVNNYLNDIINIIDASIITYPELKSQTVVFSLGRPINLLYQVIPQSLYEPELFPAIAIYKFRPLHVNLFSTGKVIILGHDALNMKCTIETYLNSILV